MSRSPLASALVRGGVVVATATVVCRLLQAGAWFALARRLAPSDFGAFAVAAIVVNALALLPGMGLSTALLARRDDPRPIAPSALTAALLCGGALAAVVAVAGQLVSTSRGGEVASVVAVLCLSLLFQGAGSVASALLDRELRFAARAAADVAGGVAFLVVALCAAWRGLGAISLALGLVSSSAVTAISACAAARLLPTRRPDWQALKGAARVGAVVLATSLLQWLFVSSDVWIVERRFGRDSVGCYAVAFQLAMVPAATLGLFSSRLALPALARARTSMATAASEAGFLRAARAALLLAAVPTALLALLAGPIVQALYGDRFAAASELLPPLALYSFSRVAGGLAGPALLVTGRTRAALWLVVAQDVLAIPTAWLLSAGYGARGTAVVFALANGAAGAAALLLGARALRAERRDLAPAPALAVTGGGGAP